MSVDLADDPVNLRLLIAGLFLLPGGCLFDGREANPDWKGLHQDEVVEILGKPSEKVDLPGGRSQLIFDQGRLTDHSGTHESWACRMYFEADSLGFIQDVSSSGC